MERHAQGAGLISNCEDRWWEGEGLPAPRIGSGGGNSRYSDSLNIGSGRGLGLEGTLVLNERDVP